MINLFIVHENTVSVCDFALLRQMAGFKEYSLDDCEIALQGSLYYLHIQDSENGKTVAFARVVGDGRTAFFIKDVVVHSDYRNKRLGKQLMENIMQAIAKMACKGAYVGVMSTPGKEFFYEKFGFIERPNKKFGSGMVLFME